jgi:NACalpha-BTF3-like transcription factor
MNLWEGHSDRADMRRKMFEENLACNRRLNLTLEKLREKDRKTQKKLQKNCKYYCPFQISDQLNRQQSSIEDDAEEKDVDMTGVDARDVEIVVSQTGCSKAVAVEALKNEDDIVNALISLME